MRKVVASGCPLHSSRGLLARLTQTSLHQILSPQASPHLTWCPPPLRLLRLSASPLTPKTPAHQSPLDLPHPTPIPSPSHTARLSISKLRPPGNRAPPLNHAPPGGYLETKEPQRERRAPTQPSLARVGFCDGRGTYEGKPRDDGGPRGWPRGGADPGRPRENRDL